MGHLENRPYNGWRNYATWRVNLEYIDGSEWAEMNYMTPQALREQVTTAIFEDYPDSIRRHIFGGVMELFLSDVDWDEIVRNTYLYKDEDDTITE